MDAILNRLSEIEESANKILGRTTERKAKFSEEMKAKTEAFDRELDEETQKKIAELKESLKRQREESLEQLRSSTQEKIGALETAYERDHSRLARKIMQRILEA